jgi:acetylornithine deacetylase/succinyl-diaminopimelate desuccinylase-like protein
VRQTRAEAWDRALDELRADDSVAAAEDHLRADDERTLATQIELSEIAAPPFQEQARGQRMAGLMREAGLSAVRTDEVGNVLGWWAPWEDDTPSRASALVLSAHLDTVFPEGTDVAVTRRGDVLRGPGISDDARGLATLLTLARALAGAPVRAMARPLLFVATVGEEGVGDLRGVKHLFGEHGAARGAAGFVSLDGAGLDRIVARGLGSRRFRIEAVGPGGHSWVDWGAPNPIHALGSIVCRLTEIALPRAPVATLTIARWGGGTSINAIPQTAWLEVDTRSESDEELADLEAEIRRVVATGASGRTGASDAADEERVAPVSASPGMDGVEVRVRSIGRRPGGATPVESQLVQAAFAATRALDRRPEIALSSTDANIPMSLGIPAITLGCGGRAGKAHTTAEWYRNVPGAEGPIRALHTVLLAAR